MTDYILMFSRITGKAYVIYYDNGICKVYKYNAIDRSDKEFYMGVYSGIINALNDVSIDIQNDINMKEGLSVE